MPVRLLYVANKSQMYNKVIPSILHFYLTATRILLHCSDLIVSTTSCRRSSKYSGNNVCFLII